MQNLSHFIFSPLRPTAKETIKNQGLNHNFIQSCLFVFSFIILISMNSGASAASLSAGKYGFSGDGKTTCGGLIKGKLQKSCGTETAVFEADAVGKCPKGTFFDVGKWSCWSCPKGYVRAGGSRIDGKNPLEIAKALIRAGVPVDGERACEKKSSKTKGKLSKAKYQGTVCPKGSIFDPTRDGECWACPKGYDRTVAPVEWKDACVKKAKTNFKKIKRYKRATGVFKTDCPKGKFWDGIDGYCYSCPKGYKRTSSTIKGKKACSKVTKAKISKANLKGKAVCKAGEILDVRNHGECWTCPTNYDRTVYPIQQSKACEIGGGYLFSQATESTPLTCNGGQTFDFVNAKHKKVQALITKQTKKKPKASLGKKGGGTCWSCPTGYRRTIAAVWDKKACESNGITWKSPVYNQPGLFGLNGAVAVVKQVIKERALINEITDALTAAAKKNKKSKASDIPTRKSVWSEIHNDPTQSSVLKIAVFSRIQLAASDPGTATTHDKALLRSFQNSVVHYKTYLADQALQAYKAWDVADKKKTEVYTGVMVAGVTTASIVTGFGTTAGIYAMGAETLRNELWPLPDFTDITLRSVIEDQLKGEAISFAYTKGLLSKTVLKKLFPSDAAVKAAKKTLTAATDGFEKKLGKFIMQKISKKIAQKATAKGATVTAKAVAKAFASAGPQILVELAIDTVVAYIELQIERANAEPRLKAHLAEAKRPFEVGRLLATVKGASEVDGQWTAVMGGEVAPKKADLIAIKKAAGIVVSSLK